MNLALPDIRLAHLTDAGRIAAMSRDLIEGGLAWSWTDARVRHAIADPCSNVAVICERADLLGFGIMQYGEEVAHLALLAVTPAYRHRGLGQRLMGWLELPARVAGIGRIRLEVRADNPVAFDFYRRQGYRSAGTVNGYYQGRIDALRLEKPLYGLPWPDEA